MAKLILVRHGKSEWNKTGQWTGWTDVGLAQEGFEEAQRAADALKDVEIHIAFVSKLTRATQTLDEIKKHLNSEIVTHSSPALNERHYGIYTGKNKWQVKEEIGDEKFYELRRGWDVKIPDGESLKEVYDRVVPYFDKQIKPELDAGKNVLVVAHGNSLRALVKYIEKIDDAAVCDIELGTGEAHCYTFEDGEMAEKEVRAENENKKNV